MGFGNPCVSVLCAPETCFTSQQLIWQLRVVVRTSGFADYISACMRSLFGKYMWPQLSAWDLLSSENSFTQVPDGLWFFQ